MGHTSISAHAPYSLGGHPEEFCGLFAGHQFGKLPKVRVTPLKGCDPVPVDHFFKKIFGTNTKKS
jgi:proteasome lid subunit RPN8/RPN11